MNCSHSKNSRRRRWRIAGGLVLVGFSSCITGEISLETAPIKVAGTAGDRAGYALDISGDLNGDGYDDLVMAAPQIGVEEVYVFFGPIPAGDLSTATPDAVFRGLSGGEAGWAVATRDVTGNGNDDLIIAAPSENGGGGVVHVLAGPLEADTVYTGNDSYAQIRGAGYFGWDVDAGDFNGDGTEDLVVGACLAYSGGIEGGAVHVVDGPVPAGVHNVSGIQRGHYIGEFHEGRLGCAVAAVGDVGGLGHDGLLVGAYQASSGPGQLPPIVGGPSFKDDPAALPAAGAAYLLYEPPSEINYRIRSAADAVFIGEHEIHNAGFAVGGRGDYNGDGHDDILLGAPGQFCTQNALHGGPGATYCDLELPPESVHMFLGGGSPGKTPAHRLEGLYVVNEADLSVYASHPDAGVAPNSTPHSTFGMSVAWTNSTGHDRIDDVIVGAPKLNRAYILYGHVGLLPAVMTTEDTGAVMYLGDHADEHAVTAQHIPTSHVLYGADAAGRVVAGSGDIDGDGIEDVAISAPGQLWFQSGPTSLAGRAFVMPGSGPELE